MCEEEFEQLGELERLASPGLFVAGHMQCDRDPWVVPSCAVLFP